jgi:cell division protease FtsH
VTIIPRGRALGITASLPEEDRHSYSKDYLFARLVMLFGGRVAEAMTFGPAKITTGAGNDIERATSMARRMVTQFGMSEAIGPMAIGDAEQEVFLGRDLGHRRQVSERTAQLVDSEVKRLLDEAYVRAEEILAAHSDLMETIALALLERETLDREEVDGLAAGHILPPLRPRDDGLLGSAVEESDGEVEPELGEVASVARGQTSERDRETPLSGPQASSRA